MEYFIRLFRDNNDNGGGGAADTGTSISDAIMASDEGFTPAADDKPADDKPADDKPGDDKPGDDKPANDKKDDTPADDPEHELDFEFEEGKGKAKMKLSELKEAVKFIHQNRSVYAGALKVRELAAKNPEFAQIMNTVLTKSFNEKGELDKDFAAKTVAAWEAKADSIEKKIEVKDDAIEEMERELEELDPDSPQYRLLKKNIGYQKDLRAQFTQQLTEANKRAADLEKKIEEVSKKSGDWINRQETEQNTFEVKRLSDTFSKEIGAMTDETKKDGYKFIDADEKAEFESMVRSIVANNAAKIKTDADFVKTIRDGAKAVYAKFSARRESIVNDYLKRTGKLPPVEKKPGAQDKKQDDKEKDPLGGQSIGEVLADAMLSDAK